VRHGDAKVGGRVPADGRVPVSRRPRRPGVVSFFEYRGGDWPRTPPPRRVYGVGGCQPRKTVPTGSPGLSASTPIGPMSWPRGMSLAFPRSRRGGRGSRLDDALAGADPTAPRGTDPANVADRGPSVDAPADVVHYMNLWAPPLARRAEYVQWPAPRSQLARRIAALTDIGPEDATTAGDQGHARASRRHSRGRSRSTTWAQGACSALIDEGRRARLLRHGCRSARRHPHVPRRPDRDLHER